MGKPTGFQSKDSLSPDPGPRFPFEVWAIWDGKEKHIGWHDEPDGGAFVRGLRGQPYVGKVWIVERKVEAAAR